MSNVTTAVLAVQESAMPSLPLDKASQWFVICVTLCSILLFAFDYLKGKIGWEGLYVCIVEATGYILSVTLDDQHIPRIGPRDEPLLRYISWLLTCPILIKVLCSLIAVDLDPNELNKLIVMDICMTISGVFGTMYDDIMAQQAFFWVGMVLAFVMVKKLFELHMASADKLDKLLERRFYFGFFLCTWTIFPLFYILGPPMYNIISPGVSVVVHSFGDFVAKNIFALMAWKMNRDWSPSKTHWESAAKRVAVVEHDDTRDSVAVAVAANSALAPNTNAEGLQHVLDGEGNILLSIQTPRPDLRTVATPESESRNLQPSPNMISRRMSGTPGMASRQLVTDNGQMVSIPQLPLDQAMNPGTPTQSQRSLAQAQSNLAAAGRQFAVESILAPSPLNSSRRLSAPMMNTGFSGPYGCDPVEQNSSVKKSKKKKKKKRVKGDE